MDTLKSFLYLFYHKEHRDRRVSDLFFPLSACSPIFAVEHGNFPLYSAEDAKHIIYAPGATRRSEEKYHLGEDHIIVLSLLTLIAGVDRFIFGFNPRQGNIIQIQENCNQQGDGRQKTKESNRSPQPTLPLGSDMETTSGLARPSF